MAPCSGDTEEEQERREEEEQEEERVQSGASCRAACSPGRLARRSKFLLEWCCGESDRHLLDGVAALRGDAEMRRGRGGDPVRWGGLAQRSEARQHLRALNDAGRARRVHGGVEANRIAHSRRRRRARACVWHGGHGGRGRRSAVATRGVGERTKKKGAGATRGAGAGAFFLVFLGGFGVGRMGVLGVEGMVGWMMDAAQGW